MAVKLAACFIDLLRTSPLLAKRTLSYELAYDFSLIGISTGLRSYRVAWWINRTLDIQLMRVEPLELLLPKTEVVAWFTRYEYLIPELESSLYLLSNAGTQGFLVPEYKTLDYFLLFDQETAAILTPDLVRTMRTIKLFQAVVPVDVDQKLRSKQHLVF